ncbi:MAG: hypothetical protein COA50_13860 [Flavobacteriaceae bacterium]|nr:MAG: hypothetical protein COA50_13860 [Flavobacteriaceae bacterium]
MKFSKILMGIFLVSSTATFSQTVKEINTATTEFLTTLSEDELKITVHPFLDSLRTQWTNLPVGLAKRPGIKFGDLSNKSKIKFHHILTTLFSSQGYLKTTSIMNLDDILNKVYATAYNQKEITEKTYNQIKRLDWDYKNYFVAVWNKPNATEPWGLKFGGHHLSINLSVVGDDFSITPLFMGTDPSEVRTTKHAGLRVLSKEEDYGFLLLNSLSEEQRKIAVISGDTPGDIITDPASTGRIDTYYGIKAVDMTMAQKNILERLIKEYINNMEFEKATSAMQTIKKSGIDTIYFAWIGSHEPNKPHYYLINGPDFLIEYDNVGFQKDGNHIHSIWREKGKNFGEDILKTHYLNHKH